MTVLITGASRGIGKAIAEIFAANGKDLFLSSRSEVACIKAMEELQTNYPSVSIKAKAFDLTDKQQAKDLGTGV
jgi:short-subunit dehydrogenase